MRLSIITLGVCAVLGLTGCSSGPQATDESRNVAKWRAGDAVVVVVADIRPGAEADVERWGAFDGVIAAWTKGPTLRISLGRQAMLADLAALELELRKAPGLRNIRDEVVSPA